MSRIIKNLFLDYYNINYNTYGVIYVIINLIDNKKYVGQTTKKMKGRWDGTLKGAENASYNQHLISSMKKYGVNNFKSKILLKCCSKDDLDFFEDYFIVVWDTINPKKGYNIKRGGLYGKFNEEKQTLTMQTIRKIRKSLLNTEKKELNSVEACMLVSCRPSVELLKQITNKYPNIDFEKTKKIIQEIEKRLWQQHMFKKSTIVVGLAMYLGNNITQNCSNFIVNDFGGYSNSYVTTQRLGKIVKMFKKRKKYTEFDIMQLIEYILIYQNWKCLQCGVELKDKSKIYCLLYRHNNNDYINKIYCLTCKEKMNNIGEVYNVSRLLLFNN